MLKFTKLLTIFFALTLLLGLANCSFAASNNKPIPVKSQVKNDTKTIVYYFYAKPRCFSCKKIEKYTKEAVESLNKNDVVYKAVDLDDPANKHYAKDYKLFTKAVVLSKIKNGKEIKSKNLTEIWTKLGNEKDFKNYVTKEIKSF